MWSLEILQRWYDPADPVHGIDHIRRVVALAEQIAEAEGADLEIVRAAAYLHDAADRKQEDSAPRKDHHLVAAELAGEVLRQAGWNEARIAAVQHCIRSHRFRNSQEAPQTLEAQVVFDADKLDAIGAVGVARAIARAMQKGMPFYAPPSSLFLDTGVLAEQETHSAYHEYWFKLRHLKERLFTPTAHRLAVERQTAMIAFFEALQAEAGIFPNGFSPLEERSNQ
ncbi:MAG: HD domain-containing protein [Anaerolineales bacterium]|nr:HD domain-containing protein [Anaerolineales bacterium]